MKKILIASTLLCAPLNALSGDWSPKTKVTEVIAGYEHGVILFKTKADHHNPKGCDDAYYTVNKEKADLQIILSMLLTAQSRNADISIGVNAEECGSGEYASGRISVSRVKIY